MQCALQREKFSADLIRSSNFWNQSSDQVLFLGYPSPSKRYRSQYGKSLFISATLFGQSSSLLTCSFLDWFPVACIIYNWKWFTWIPDLVPTPLFLFPVELVIYQNIMDFILVPFFGMDQTYRSNYLSQLISGDWWNGSFFPFSFLEAGWILVWLDRIHSLHHTFTFCSQVLPDLCHVSDLHQILWEDLSKTLPSLFGQSSFLINYSPQDR